MKKILSTLVLAAMAMSLMAVPARRGWQTKTQPDGTTITVRHMGDEFYHYWEDQNGNQVKQDANGYWQVVGAAPTGEQAVQRMTARRAARPNSVMPRMATKPSTLPTKLLVLVVNFKDIKMKSAHNAAYFESALNTGSNSAKAFFNESSDGHYVPTFDIFGPLTLDSNESTYGENEGDEAGADKDPAKMVVDACAKAAAAGCNFANYDTDGDGVVDNVYVIYAGKGEADGGAESTIWPHSWDLNSAGYRNVKYNGKTVKHYACSSELDGSGNFDGIGTFCHEFSHVIGLPDYYDTDYGTNYKNGTTPGEWTLMDGGSYNDNPPLYSIFDKYYMGWATPKILKGKETVTLGIGSEYARQITSTDALVPYSNTSTVYYVENRSENDPFDRSLPGKGMLIWKVQFNQTAWNNNNLNNTAGTLRYTVVSASGKTTKIGTSTDAFPAGGTSVSLYNDNNHKITEVTRNSSTEVVTFKYNGGSEKVTITFNGNGKGTPSSASLTEATAGAGVTLPNVTGVTSGYTFLGWATSSTATTPDAGTAGQNFKSAVNCTLWAVYKREGYVNVEYNLEGITKVTGPAAGEFLKTGGYSATFTATEGKYEPLTVDNCLYEVTVNGVDKTSNYASLAGNTLTITIAAANITGDIVVTIIGTKIKGSNTFELIESTSELSAGDEVIFVCEGQNVAATNLVYEKTFLGSEEVTITDHQIDLEDDSEVQVFTLGGTTGNWTFAREDGTKLGVTGVKNISFGSSATNTWTISISSGTATVTSTTSSYGTMKYNSDAPRFTTYASGQNNIQLYRRAAAIVQTDGTASFENSSVTMTVGDVQGQVVHTNSNGEVTYSSNNSAVATVDATTGAVTAIKQGTATITANVAANKRYTAASASYTVTVNRATATITSVDNFTVKVGKTYTLDATTTSDATISYAIADGSKLSGNGKVFTGVAAGNTTVTLSTAQTDKYAAAQKVVNVTVEAVVMHNVNWSANGIVSTVKYEDGEALVAPAQPANCSADRIFQGWTSNSTYSGDVAPTYITLGNAVTANATYYAVYATVENGASAPVVVSKDNFTSAAGNLDANISYNSAKGNGTSDPYVTNGFIRIYQGGGIFTVSAKNGKKISSITLGTHQSTTIDVKVDGSSYVTGQSMSTSTPYTASELDATTIAFYCMGDKNHRLEVNQLSVTYQDAGASVVKSDYSTTCTAAAAVDPTLAFEPASETMTVGERKVVAATSNSTGAITYAITSGDAATVNVSTGEVTAVKQGTVTLRATVAATAKYNQKTVDCTITVNRATGTITANDVTVKVEATKSIGATTNSDATISYTSAATGTATVSDAGVVTGGAEGSTTITLNVAQTDKYTAAQKVINVTVTAAAVAPTISFAESSVTAKYGDAVEQQATTNSDGAVSYKSSNTSVADVDSETGEVTIKTVGTVTIKATVAETDNFTAGEATYTLTINKGQAVITLNTLTNTVQVGGIIAGGWASTNIGTISYSSNNAGVAIVGTDGKITAKGAGTATITASVTGTANYNGASETYVITVTGASGIDMQAHVASPEGRSAYTDYVAKQNAYYTGDAAYATMMTQSGAGLFGTLNTKMGQTKQSGGSYDDLRDKYVNVDRDLNKAGNIIGYYNGQSMNGTWDGGTTYNREHTWPQSKGATKTIPMGYDMQSVRPASASVNSSRGNKAYGEGNSTYYYNTDDIAINNANYKPENMGSYHGDAARVILYDYIVYGEMGGHKNSYYNGNAQLLSKLGSSGVFESLPILLKWHMEDPPSLTEMVRNDGAQAYKGNRNPFIDYPELAILILKDEASVTEYTVTNATNNCTITPNYTYTLSSGFVTYVYNADGVTHPSEVSVTATSPSNSPRALRKAAANDPEFTYNATTGRLIVSGVKAPIKITSVVQDDPVVNFTITTAVNDANMGSVTAGGSYPENTPLHLTATPKSGYRFVKWLENGVEYSVSASINITVTADKTYTAVFELIPIVDEHHTVIWVSDGQVIEEQDYVHGAALELPSTTPADCGSKTFQGWTGMTNYFSPTQPPSDMFMEAEGKTVTEDKTYYAVFK
ncbi:MAG: M6 family metalloprotease domain-containing protein [Paludibacteraceae bacterium]|nr:M6 family metalloprotease domain-containing protein [Paludibacteraceae bacterium]